MRGLVSLERALSKLGFCSRTQAADLIAAGRVGVDGRVLRNPLTRIDMGGTKLTVDGKLIGKPELVVYAFHKPAGVVTTRSDERGRKTVYDAFRASPGAGDRAGDWLAPVGRLDADTRGLLLFTNSTRLAALLTEPDGKVMKTYRALVSGALSEESLRALAAGVDIHEAGESYVTRPAKILSAVPSGRNTAVTLAIAEGRNRQVRKMFHSLGHKVRALVRTHIGGLGLEGLKPGESRQLGAGDLKRLAAGSPNLARFLDQSAR